MLLDEADLLDMILFPYDGHALFYLDLSQILTTTLNYTYTRHDE